MLSVRGFPPLSAAANALSTPPGEYDRKVETKGIDGDPHKRWSMWFNSKQREEPYQILTSFDNSRDRAFPFGDKVTGGAWLSSARVVDVGLSPATSATLKLTSIIKLGTLS